jgi:integrase
MVAEELIDRNPVINIKKVRVSTVAKSAPTSGEVKALVEKAKGLNHPWLGDYVVALAGTGARPQEVLRARCCDFDELNGLLRIVAYDGREIKTGRDRTIAVSPEVKEALAKRKVAVGSDKPDAPLFPAPAYYAKFTRYVWRLLGKESLKPYDLRHHFCTMAPTWGWSLERTAAYVGNSIQVLERFYQDRKAMQLGAPPALATI